MHTALSISVCISADPGALHTRTTIREALADRRIYAVGKHVTPTRHVLAPDIDLVFEDVVVRGSRMHAGRRNINCFQPLRNFAVAAGRLCGTDCTSSFFYHTHGRIDIYFDLMTTLHARSFFITRPRFYRCSIRSDALIPCDTPNPIAYDPIITTMSAPALIISTLFS